MRILILGAGAVGGILGGALLRNGHDAVFLARGKNLQVLRERGLKVEWPEESWNFDRVAVAEAGHGGDFDAVLFCVKGYDWESSASLLPSVTAPRVYTFQNGVLVHKELAARIPSEVLGSVIYVAADRTEPGVVTAKAAARVVLDGRPGARAFTDALAAALSVPQVKVVVSDNIELDLWRKYLFLCSFSAINTLTEKSVAPILKDSDVRELWARAMREIVAVANACGVQLTDADVDTAMAGAAKFPPGTSSSLLADTLRRQSTEVELLQGHLARLAKKCGVEAPVTRALYALLKLKTQF